ncbi:hypothetical protein PR202_gb23007 [Eleusine coracana subsp. coracana]|uniref:Uncharacterized protein n=1 Tax=Eleusine coracana subsp. coracana TaxID=191504 RepID=A0AAV5FHA5_ELECO|nr:hypothetical protein PR202_gb23007 [Eleusine coracana subsp. coracana]
MDPARSLDTSIATASLAFVACVKQQAPLQGAAVAATKTANTRATTRRSDQLQSEPIGNKDAGGRWMSQSLLASLLGVCCLFCLAIYRSRRTFG